MYNIKGLRGLSNVRESIFFTSDHRLFDYNVIDNVYRFYDNMDDMVEDYIQKWNKTIGKNDIVFHIGNFSSADQKMTEEILNRLNGRINLIVGAFDNSNNILGCKRKLSSINYKLEIFIDNTPITLNHHPQRKWNRQYSGAYHLHGYERHMEPPQKDLSLDVGVDGYDGYPLNYEEIVGILERKRKQLMLN